MADPATWTEVGAKGKDVKNDDSGGINEGNGLDMKNTITMRIEHFERYNEYGVSTYNIAAATDAIVAAIVNSHEDIKVLSLDGKNVINKLKSFGSLPTLRRFVKSIEAETAKKDGVRYTSLFKLLSTVPLRDIKKNEDVRYATSEWKWSMYNHQLSMDHVEAKLIFNIFMVNPYATHKNMLQDKINERLKDFIKHSATQELRNKLSESFCKWVKNTNDNIIEVGNRLWKANYNTQDGDFREIEAEIFTIKADGTMALKVKDLIKAIKWDERTFGLIKDENPELNCTNTMIKIAHQHNHFCNTFKYLKVTNLPLESMNIKVPEYNNRTVEQILLEEETTSMNNNSTYMIHSVIKINRIGTHYMLVQEGNVEEAQIFLSKLFATVSVMDEHKDNYLFVDSENSVIGVSCKDAASMTGSEISTFEKEQFKPIDTTQDEFMSTKYLKTRTKKPSLRGTNVTVNSTSKSRRSKRPDDSSYAYDYVNPSTESTEPFIMEVTSYADAVRGTNKTPGLEVEENSTSSFKATPTTTASAKETISMATLHEMIKKLQEEQKMDRNENKRLKEENDRLLREVFAQETKIRSMQENRKTDDDEDKITSELFPPSPMPEHKEKRSKNEISGMKRTTMSTEPSATKSEDQTRSVTFNINETINMDTTQATKGTHDADTITTLGPNESASATVTFNINETIEMDTTQQTNLDTDNDATTINDIVMTSPSKEKGTNNSNMTSTTSPSKIKASKTKQTKKTNTTSTKNLRSSLQRATDPTSNKGNVYPDGKAPSGKGV